MSEKEKANSIMDYKYLEFGQNASASSFLTTKNHFNTHPKRTP
jgi:hypothetical protein